MISTNGRGERTRLAPSPTGALHWGNARTFVVNWALARQRGWHVVLRIDDLDSPRTKRGADQEAIELLQWLGLDWDSGPYYQTPRSDRYGSVLEQLAQQGQIYPCRCTRSEIEAASLSAPHGDSQELRYPGTCRPAEPCAVSFRRHHDDPAVAWRFRLPAETPPFCDQFAGWQAFDLPALTGDFLVATKGGQPSYQLAVVVDDIDQQITQVIRGNDLLSSTPRQQALFHALGVATLPNYWHVPLVLGADGRRLAKRHGDTRIATYRQAGVTASQMMGWIARTCGFPESGPLSAAQFCDLFDMERLSREPVVWSGDQPDLPRLPGSS